MTAHGPHGHSSRQPAGIPTGGQFAPGSRGRADLPLDDQASEAEVVLASAQQIVNSTTYHLTVPGSHERLRYTDVADFLAARTDEERAAVTSDVEERFFDDRHDSSLAQARDALRTAYSEEVDPEPYVDEDDPDGGDPDDYDDYDNQAADDWVSTYIDDEKVENLAASVRDRDASQMWPMLVERTPPVPACADLGIDLAEHFPRIYQLNATEADRRADQAEFADAVARATGLDPEAHREALAELATTAYAQGGQGRVRMIWRAEIPALTADGTAAPEHVSVTGAHLAVMDPDSQKILGPVQAVPGATITVDTRRCNSLGVVRPEYREPEPVHYGVNESPSFTPGGPNDPTSWLAEHVDYEHTVARVEPNATHTDTPTL